MIAPCITPDVIEALFAHLDSEFDEEAFALQPRIYAEAFAAHADASVPERVAEGFAAYLDAMPLDLGPGDVLAGHIQYCNVPLSTPCRFDGAPGVRPMTFPYAADEAHQRRLNDAAEPRDDADRAALDRAARGCLTGLYVRGPFGHVIPGFGRILKLGFAGLLREIERSAARPHTDFERAYLRAMARCLEAAQRLCLRYAKAARALAEGAADAAARRRMVRIASACEHIAGAPAADFFEAVQLVTLIQALVAAETPSGSLSLGRLDQLFYPYYAADLAAGQLAPAEAAGIIDAFRIKLGAMAGSFQNVCLGGRGADGRWAGNAVTRMFMDSARRLRMDQPLLSLRVTQDMPDDVWEEALDLLSMGDGFPALFNDPLITEALRRSGIDESDAWDFGIVGCVEPDIAGKEFSNTEEMRVSWAKALELSMNGGRCRLTGERLADVPDGEPATFEAFFDRFRTVLGVCLDDAVRACDALDRGFWKKYPVPFLSSTMEGCIERGMDVADRGTVYRRSSVNCTGMASAVDSLLAVRELVYRRGVCSLAQLNAALDADFAGYEPLQAMAANLREKLGNGSDDAMAMLRELSRFSVDRVAGLPNCRGDRFRLGMYSVSHHAGMGELTGALPDGRKARTALSSGMSPVQGADRQGPTAALEGVLSADHRDFANGMVMDLKFTPDFFREPARRAGLRALIEGYFEQGGMELQLNAVDRDTLIAAQADPDSYRDLIVRVSGFSAYFVTLTRTLQDEIIARTAHDHV